MKAEDVDNFIEEQKITFSFVKIIVESLGLPLFVFDMHRENIANALTKRNRLASKEREIEGILTLCLTGE